MNIKKLVVVLIVTNILTFAILPGIQSNNTVSANPVGLLVGKAAQKLLGGIAVKGGVRGTQKAVSTSIKTTVKKNGGVGRPDLGKPIMPPQQWIMQSKKAPTKKTHGGKFLKYTLSGASILGMAGMLSGSVADLPTDQEGNIVMTYDDPYNEELISSPNVIATTQFEARAGGTGNRTIYVDYLNLTTGQWETASPLFLGYRKTLGQVISTQLNPSSSNSIKMTYSIVDSETGEFREFAISSVGILPEDFFPLINEIKAEKVTYQEKFQSSSITTTNIPEQEIVPEGKEEVEIYIPNNEDGLQQILDNPDILYNPDPYVNEVPEGDPTVTEDAAGEPIEEADPGTDPGTNPGGGTGSPDLDPGTQPQINLEPLKQVGTEFTRVFPFSLPWDIKRGIDSLTAEKEEPTFTIAMPLPGGIVKHEIKIPEGLMDYLPLVKGSLVAMFIIGLIYGTRSLMGGSV